MSAYGETSVPGPVEVHLVRPSRPKTRTVYFSQVTTDIMTFYLCILSSLLGLIFFDGSRVSTCEILRHCKRGSK